MSCERLWEARAIDEGRFAEADALSFRRHMRTCGVCQGEMHQLESLRGLASQLPAPEADELQLRRLRSRVLRDAMSPPRSKRPLATLALASVVAVLALLVWARVHRGAKPEAFAAVVTPYEGAAWTQARASGVERVTLTVGRLSLSVRKQKTGERFLVMVPDGEIEVRGTTFEVAVEQRKTTRVHVDEGVVVVRVDGEVTLLAGETWPRAAVPSEELPPSSQTPSAPETAVVLDLPAEAPSRAASSSPASARRGPPRPPAPASTSTEELADYRRAIEAYRLGRFGDASDLFHGFVVTYPSSLLLDDASFLEAASLASAGRGDAAGLLAKHHLTRFPRSFHRKAAAILLARAERDRGDCESARASLEAWAGDGGVDPELRAALGACATGAR